MASSGQDFGGLLNNENGRQLSKLEQALDGQSAETVSRVRDYARTFDLDQDDKLFAFVAAMGLLTVLVQDAPEDWRAFFDEMLQDLDRWADENRRSFSQLEQYANSANRLEQALGSAVSGIDEANNSRRTLLKEVLKEVAKNAGLTRQLAGEIGTRLNSTDKRIEAGWERSLLAAILAETGIGVSVLLLLCGGITSMRLLGQNKELRQEL